jgi:glutamate racemase
MPRVLILDSGVGGLSVARAIRATLPDVALVYLADNAWFPYGKRPEGELIARLVQLVEHALQHSPCDAVVVACNTASTVALEALRSQFAIPIVGVVPPIKTAGRVSRSRVVGLLATEATVTRPYVRKLKADFAADCRLVPLGLSRLAEMAEGKLRGLPVDREELRALLAPFFGADAPQVDTVVLGCTHYPLLLADFQAVSPSGVQWLDSSPAIARRLAQVLAQLPPQSSGSLEEAVYFTAPIEGLAALTAYLAKIGLPAPQLWPGRVESVATGLRVSDRASN